MFTYCYVSNALTRQHVENYYKFIFKKIQPSSTSCLVNLHSRLLSDAAPCIVMLNIMVSLYHVSHKSGILYVMNIKHKLQYLSVVLALLLFLCLTVGVMSNATWIDSLNRLVRNIIQQRSPLADSFFFNVTQLGGVTFTILLTIILSAILGYYHHYRQLGFLIVNVLFFAGFITQLVKRFVQNPRPLPQLIPESGFSFPSGHTMMAVLLYGTLIILAHINIKQQHIRNIIIGLLAILMVLIPISRIYINVHHPTDIFAGVTLGYSLLVLSTKIFHIGGTYDSK